MNIEDTMKNLINRFQGDGFCTDQIVLFDDEFEVIKSHIDMLENYQKHAQDDLNFYAKKIAELEEKLKPVTLHQFVGSLIHCVVCGEGYSEGEHY